MKTIRIKPGSLRLKDGSKRRREFFFDGQAYSVTGVTEVSVPDIVATSWATHDSGVEVWNPNNR